MDNAGGIIRLYWIDAEDYSGLSLPVGGEVAELLMDRWNINEVEFADEGGSLSISDRDDDAGVAYIVSINLKVAKVSSSGLNTHASLKESLTGRRVIFIARDNNGQFILIGGTGAYFNVTRVAETGTVMADMNMTRLQIAAEIPDAAVFISDPLVGHWGVTTLDSFLELAGVQIDSEYKPDLTAGQSYLTIGLMMTGSEELTDWFLYEDDINIDSSGEAGIAIEDPYPMVYHTFNNVVIKAGSVYRVHISQH